MHWWLQYVPELVDPVCEGSIIMSFDNSTVCQAKDSCFVSSNHYSPSSHSFLRVSLPSFLALFLLCLLQLIFSNADNDASRMNGTLHISRDSGASYQFLSVIDPGPFGYRSSFHFFLFPQRLTAHYVARSPSSTAPALESCTSRTSAPT
jgi:hypothetical protein